MTQETLHQINGIQGVIKFVGHERMPQPLRPEEVNRLLGVADDSEPEEVRKKFHSWLVRQWRSPKDRSPISMEPLKKF